MRGWSIWILLLVSAALAVSLVWRVPLGASAAAGSEAPRVAEPLRYVAVGGGAAPESTEVSLEQDIALAVASLRPPGRVLFGGGRGALSVRLEEQELPRSALLTRLGDVFQPRVGRHSRYRASTLGADPATLAEVNATLVRALSRGTEPLLLYVAAHGEQGQKRRDGRVVLWGNQVLTVAALGALHEDHPRPLRVVMASCFSGGFAELAFRATDATQGGTVAPRCGLFAGTWNRETSGCDPSPDRRTQEGYSLHFLQALGMRDRAGVVTPASEFDIDGDGRVSLLEAHARARIASRSIDVPTTTSERYLRVVVKQDAGAADASFLPEETAVVEALSDRLGLPDRGAAEERWRSLDRQLRHLDRKLTQAEASLDERYRSLATRLLSRWPVLDDPYHPGFAAMLARDAVAIETALETSPEGRQYREAQQKLQALDARFWDLQVEEAIVTRLVRAHDTLSRAAALRQRGGDEWKAYRRLLECERWAPELRAG